MTFQVLVRHVSSTYHDDSAKFEKNMKLDTTNRQYVTVKNEVRPKLGLLWGLGRSPKSTMAGFRTWSSYILLDGKFSAH